MIIIFPSGSDTGHDTLEMVSFFAPSHCINQVSVLVSGCLALS